MSTDSVWLLRIDFLTYVWFGLEPVSGLVLLNGGTNLIIRLQGPAKRITTVIQSGFQC